MLWSYLIFFRARRGEGEGEGEGEWAGEAACHNLHELLKVPVDVLTILFWRGGGGGGESIVVKKYLKN